MIFNIFSFEFMSEYFNSLISYHEDDEKVICMISSLSKSCIVYQLIGCTKINELIGSRWNMIQLLTPTKDIFNDNKEEEIPTLSLVIDILSLIVVLTNKFKLYKNKQQNYKKNV